MFCIGVYGMLSRRNAIGVLLCLELMANAVNLNLVAFARYTSGAAGQVFTLFAIALTVAEVVVGLAIVMLLHRTTPRSTSTCRGGDARMNAVELAALAGRSRPCSWWPACSSGWSPRLRRNASLASGLSVSGRPDVPGGLGACCCWSASCWPTIRPPSPWSASGSWPGARPWHRIGLHGRRHLRWSCWWWSPSWPPWCRSSASEYLSDEPAADRGPVLHLAVPVPVLDARPGAGPPTCCSCSPAGSWWGCARTC